MTVAFDAVHAENLLGKNKFLEQMASHKQYSQEKYARQNTQHGYTVRDNVKLLYPATSGGTTYVDVLLFDCDLAVSNMCQPAVTARSTDEAAYLIRTNQAGFVPNIASGVWTVHHAPHPISVELLPGYGAKRADPLKQQSSTQHHVRRLGAATRILDEIEALRDGWDGPGSVAPTQPAKITAYAVVAQAAAFVSVAEIEVDPTVGNPAFHWFSDDQRSVVSLTIQAEGGVVIIATSVVGATTRISIGQNELDRIGRALVDAGVGRLNDHMR